MRLLKLTMCAFGPYAKEQTIDFSKIKDKKLFLITGPTGAGKTSIFDAVSYALFGQSSGNERDGDSLISHFSSVEEETFVSLEFELKNKHYYVKRSPKQVRKKVKGDGTTTQVASAELIIGDKVYTGVNEVNQKLQEILGINYNQFKQIVMLPQGEFRKLLEANSLDREEIFRKIFRTESFKTIQERLKSRTSELKTAIGNTYQLLNNNVEKINVQNNHELENCILNENKDYEKIISLTRALNEDMNQQLTELIHVIQTSDQFILSLEKDITEGNEINKKFAQLTDLMKQKENLKERKDEIQGISKKIAKAKDASFILQIEVDLNKVKDQTKHLKQLNETLKDEHKNRDLELMRLNEKLCESKEAHDCLKENREHVFSLKQQISKYSEYHTLKNELKGLLKQKEGKDLNFKKVNELVNTYQNRINDLKLKMESLQKMNQLMGELKLKRSEILTSQKEANHIIKILKELNRVREEHRKLSKQYILLEKEYKEAKVFFDEKNDTFLASQAGILALGLKENEPCPVCGSFKHPNKAVLVDSVLSEKELKELKLELEEKKKEVDDLYVLVYNLNQNSIELEQSLKEVMDETPDQDVLSYYEEKEKHIRYELQEFDNHICAYEKAISEEEQVKQDYEMLMKKYDESIAQIEGLKEDIQKDQSKIQVKESLIQKLEEEYIHHYPSEEDLQEEIHKEEEKIKATEDTYKKCVDDVTRLKEQNLILLTKISQNKEMIESNKQVIITEEKHLLDELSRKQFKDKEEYQSYIFTDEELNGFLSEINEYNEHVNYVDKTLVHINEELKGKTPVSIDLIKEKQFTEQTENNVRKEEEKNLHAILQNNRSIIHECDRLYKKVENKIQTYNVLSDISKVANGDNAERLTFERYVLAAYFDEIIHAANLRLSDMTNKRYILCRKEEKGKGNAQQGLDLEVIDFYTGKTRTVKTLSGGEAFIASLALALGLADVVQSYSGGIELDTIFIDEGFGSLDPESLEHAIETLVGIQRSGRLVGIISHVEELKERIDVKLQITPSKEGSIAAFNC